LATVYRHRAGLGKGGREGHVTLRRPFEREWRAGLTTPAGSSHAGPLAALTFHDPVALLDHAFARAVLALLLLLDIGALFVGHDTLLSNLAGITMIPLGIPVHPATPTIPGITMSIQGKTIAVHDIRSAVDGKP
jgi:hypothetical protein